MAPIRSLFRKTRLACALSSSRHGTNNRLKQRARYNYGFSLVEVVLAMGIVAVAFIPLMGLLPMGLSASRQAIDTTIQAQILQQMTGQAQQNGFSNLTTLCSTSAPATYFDANGHVVATAAAAVYMAAFGTAANTTLPGGAVTKKLDTLSIYILTTRAASGASIQSDVVANAASKKYTVFVADTGL